MSRLWRDHSLTIILAVVGVVLFGLAARYEPGTRGWDIFLGLSQGVLTICLYYSLAGVARERNKPED